MVFIINVIVHPPNLYKMTHPAIFFFTTAAIQQFKDIVIFLIFYTNMA